MRKCNRFCAAPHKIFTLYDFFNIQYAVVHCKAYKQTLMCKHLVFLFKVFNYHLRWVTHKQDLMFRGWVKLGCFLSGWVKKDVERKMFCAIYSIFLLYY